jgi:hypothetical protein
VGAGDAHTSVYLLRNLAAYLQDDAQRQKVYVDLLLKQFEWSQARLDISGVGGLLTDLVHLHGHPEQPWLRALVSQAEPALRVSTSQWPAQVFGRLGVSSQPPGRVPISAPGSLCTWALNDSRRGICGAVACSESSPERARPTEASGSYRRRAYCVMEGNQFMTRLE